MKKDNRPEIVRVGLIGLGNLARSLVPEDRIRVVMNAVSAEDASDALMSCQPELFLVFSGDDLDQTSVRITHLKKRSRDQKVLMLAENPTLHGMIEAIKSQAVGYLPVASPTSQIVNAVHKVAEGRTALDRELSNEALRHMATNSSTNGVTNSSNRKISDPNLSAREIEVLETMARGLSNALIADELYISPGTVKSHVERIIKKLDSSDRTDAVVKGLEFGLIRFPGRR